MCLKNTTKLQITLFINIILNFSYSSQLFFIEISIQLRCCFLASDNFFDTLYIFVSPQQSYYCIDHFDTVFF